MSNTGEIRKIPVRQMGKLYKIGKILILWGSVKLTLKYINYSILPWPILPVTTLLLVSHFPIDARDEMEESKAAEKRIYLEFISHCVSIFWCR